MEDDLFRKLYNRTQIELAKTQDKNELEVARQYGKVLLECRKKLDAFYRKHAEDGRLSNADKTMAAKLKGLQDSIEETLGRRIPAINTYTGKLTGEMYEESYYHLAYSFDQAGGMALRWGLVPEEAVEAAVKGTYDTFARSRNLSVAQAKAVELVRNEISLAVIRGDSYQKLAARIGKAIGCEVTDKGRVRYGNCGAAAWSMMVARTEGQRVLVEGQTAAYDRARELGCDIEIVWDATLDARTRPAHGALDGKVQDDPEKGWWVESLGKYVSAPLHSGVAAFDVNCRCRKRAQVKGFPPDVRYVRGDGVIPYQTYQEWKDKMTGTFYTIDVTTPDGAAVTSLSEHIKFRMNERSLTKADIIDAFANPLETEQKIRYNEQGQPSKRYIGAKATVNVNPVTGVATTAWRTGSKTVDKIGRKKK